MYRCYNVWYLKMGLTSKQLEEFWNIADANNDGQLTVQELARAVRNYDKNVSDASIAVSTLFILNHFSP